MEILNKYSYDPQTDMLGKGGFATVYKAYDKILDMPVALKFFQPQDAANKYTIINEIKRAIILSHPNIVKYYGVETLVNRNFHGQEEEVQIGVMEFVQEGQMKTYMSKNPLNLDQLKKLLIDILEGLKYLHSEGVIHRDIKPQNILLGRDKQNRLVAKIADFGISKSADSNQASASILLGTIEYMAPEQFNPERYGINKKISYNVDVWAFGVTAYYLLTGELLFGSRSGDTSAAEMISKIVSAEGLTSKLDNVEEPFKSLLKRCIISNANERTNDIDELIAILKGQQYIKSEPQKDDFFYNTQNKSGNLSHFHSKNEPENIQGTVSSEDHTQEIEIPQKTTKSKKESHKKKELKNIDDNDSTIEIDVREINKKTEPEVIHENFENVIQTQIEPTKKKKSKLILILAIGVVFSVAIGGYFIFNKQNTNEVNVAEEPQDIKLTKDIIANMILIPSGEFSLGTNDPKRNTDGPERLTKINQFLLNKYEVTQKEWNIIMKDGRYSDTTLQNHPADGISWNDAVAFIQKINQNIVIINNSNNKSGIKEFRLPKNAEWEYACLKGLTEQYNLSDISWNVNNSNKESHKIGTKAPLTNNLHDMLGNVYEWCEDWYGAYGKEASKEGKVLRGGDYENDIFFVHPKSRNAEVIAKRNKNIGFRLAAEKSE